MALEFRMRDYAEDLREGDKVLRAFLRFYRSIRIVEDFVEFGRLLVGAEVMASDAGKRFS